MLLFDNVAQQILKVLAGEVLDRTGDELEGSEDSYLAVYRSDGTDFVTIRGMLEIAAEVDFTRCDEDADDD